MKKSLLDIVANSDEIINEPEKRKYLRNTAMGALGAYGAIHGTKHITPATQALANRWKRASTRIEGFYDKGVTNLDKVKMTFKHGFDGDIPALTKYLEKYTTGPDPVASDIMPSKKGFFGRRITDEYGNPILETTEGGATKRNIKNLRKGIKQKGGMFGLKGGVETADELMWASARDNAQTELDAITRTDWKTGQATYTDDKLARRLKKSIGKSENMLRYETQKTELIKHSFGEPINELRWRNSGLGELKTTTLKDALDNNSRAIRAWKKSSGFLAGRIAGLDDNSRVTVSQYRGKDHNTLMRNVKNWGSTYLKYDDEMAESMGKVLGRATPVTRQRVNGIFDLAKQAFQRYESDIAAGLSKDEAFKNISNWLDIVKKNAVGNKRTVEKAHEMIETFRKNVDFKDGKLAVSYSPLTTQQTVASVHSDIEIWRGKGKGIGDVGKIHHKVLVSDMYDVSGGAGSVIQKNIHFNIARQTSADDNLVKFGDIEVGETRKKIMDKVKAKDIKGATKLLPQLSKKGLIRIAKFIATKRMS